MNFPESSYKFLIEKHNAKIIDQVYDSESFGNYYTELECQNLGIMYVNDRGNHEIMIWSRFDPAIDEFIKNEFAVCNVGYCLSPHQIDCDNYSNMDNENRIKSYNQILENNFDSINELLSLENYTVTIERWHKLLKERFERRAN